MKSKSGMVSLIAAVIFIALFIVNYANYQLAAVPGTIMQTYNIGNMEFSSLMTGPMLPCIFLSIIAGVLVDRFGIPKIVGICLIISCIGMVMRVFAADYTTMLLAMALMGFSGMVLNSNLAKIASSMYPMEKVSGFVGIMMAASTAAMAVAYGTTWAFPNLEIMFWVPAIINIVVAVFWILFAKDKVFSQNSAPAEASGTAPEQASVKDSLLTCLKSKNIWITGISLMFMLGGAMVIANFHVAAATTMLGYSEAVAGSFNTVLMIGSALGSIAMPIIVTKYPSKAPIIVLILGIIAAASSVGMVMSNTMVIYVSGFLNGALRSGIIAVMMMIPVMFPEIGPKYAGTAGGVVVTLELIGAVIIPTYVVVPLAAGNFLTYFYLAAAAILISVILCTILVKTSGAFSKDK